jgi:protein TonB
VDFGEVDVSDVSDDSFAEDGAWEITNRPDNPEGGSGVIVVGADNRPPAVAPPPPPPSPVPRAPVGSSGGGTGTGPGTGRRAPEFRPETDVSRPPEVDEEIRADYPEEARRDGIQGAVRLLVMIRKDGTVYRVRVLEDPGGGLGDAAKRALERFRFRPAVGRNGDPVDYQITYTYRFVLDS